MHFSTPGFKQIGKHPKRNKNTELAPSKQTKEAEPQTNSCFFRVSLFFACQPRIPKRGEQECVEGISQLL